MESARTITIRRFVGGPMLTACYLIVAPGRESILIDAPRDAWQGAIDAAGQANAPVRLLIATHGHWDHITDAGKLRERGVPLAGHRADRDLFANPMDQRRELPFVVEPVELDRELGEGSRLDVGDVEVQILHTPGHTPGSISIWIPDEDALFTGDTLLKGGAGYLERPECDPWALATSVQRIAALPERTTLYPGHGPPTTIAGETWLADSHDRQALIAEWQSGRSRWTPRAAH